jgi:DNA-binding NarL/FixJ family response regulator
LRQRVFAHVRNVKQRLLLEPSEVVGRCTVILCGHLLLHRKLFNDSLTRTAGVSVVRCSESLEEVFRVRHQTKAVFVARQNFLEQLSPATVLQITDFGRAGRVLAILDSNTVDPISATKMLRLGCHGVLPNQFPSKLFSRAVMAILRGEFWAPHAVVSDLLSDLLRAASLKADSGLTQQELRILDLSSQGYKNAAIADVLFISLETVRWHKRRLNRKLRDNPERRRSQTRASSQPHELAAG